MKSILYELRRSINGNFFLGTICIALLLLHGDFSVFLHPNGGATNLDFITTSTSLGLITMLAPSLCTIAYASSFTEDYLSGYIRFLLIREEKWSYYLAKLLATCVSGGATLAIGYIVVILIASLLLTPFGNEPVHILLYTDTALESLCKMAPYGIMAFLGQILSAFLFGMVWAAVGLTMSVLIPNKFVAVASPLVLYSYLTTVLQQIGLNVLSPNKLNVFRIPLSDIVVYQVLFLALICIIYFFAIPRRLRYV